MWIDRRWLVPGIAFSVLLNVFLIGIVAGHVYAGRTLPPERAPLVPAARVHALPPDEREKFLSAMARQRPAIVAARKAHLAARRVLEAEIADAAFDPARVTAGFADLRQAGAALQVQSHAALVAALAVLSQRSRAALVAHPAGAEDGR